MKYRMFIEFLKILQLENISAACVEYKGFVFGASNHVHMVPFL